MCVRKGCQGPRDSSWSCPACPALPCPPAERGRKRSDPSCGCAALPGWGQSKPEVQQLQMSPVSQTSSWIQSLGVLQGPGAPSPPSTVARAFSSVATWPGASGHHSLVHTHPPSQGIPQMSWASLSHKKITFAQASQRFSLRQKLLYVKRSPGVGKFAALVTAAAVCDQYNLNFPPKPHFTAISFHHRFHRAGGQRRGAHTCWKIHIYW